MRPRNPAVTFRLVRDASHGFGYGGPLTELGLLGLVALRFPGEKLEWDGATQRFPKHAAATALVNPPYRSGWSL